MGPIRLRRIVRNLARHGYEPVVLTSPATSRSLGVVPENVEILRAESVDLAEMYRRLFRRNTSGNSNRGKAINQTMGITSAINRWFMIPDKQIVWRRAALKLARTYLQNHPVDIIFASLAPRTNLLVARQLSGDFNLPCIQEFRDLWTGSPYHHLDQATRLHRWIHARLERSVIRDATRVSVVCRGLAHYLEGKYGRDIKEPIALNYNFFDPEEYQSLPVRTFKPGERMVVSYVGAMYATRNPYVFFEGMRRWIDTRGISPEYFRFRWVGSVVGVPEVEAMIERLQLREFIDFEGQKTHADALRVLQESDASLIIQAPGDSVHIPGKLFEAMGARVPVLAMSDPCEVTEIIGRTRAGWICGHDEISIAEALDRVREHAQAGANWKYIEAERDKFSADVAVGNLATMFNKAIDASCPVT